MNILIGIAFIFMLGLIVGVYEKIYVFYTGFTHICKIILTPISTLQTLLLEVVRGIALPVRMILLALSVLGACGFLVISYFSFEDLSAYLTTILENITFISFLNMLIDGISPQESINYPAMVSVCVSSFFAFLFMQHTTGTVEDLTDGMYPDWLGIVVKWIALAVLNLIFFCTAAMIAYHISDWCTAAAAYLLNFYKSLGSPSPEGAGMLARFFHGVFVVLAFLVLTYGALASFTIVVQEYLGTLVHGMFSVGLLIIIALIFQEQINNMPPALNAILTLFLIFSGDLFRGYMAGREDI